MIDLADILPKLSQHISSGSVIWVGYSGGLDSTVLLHLLSNLERQHKGVSVKAIHINHQMSPNAQQWQRQCHEVAASMGVPIESVLVHVKNAGRGLEDSARQERMKIFASLIGANDVLVCGHHRDDQAETLLYRLIRGSGLKGLGGIAECRELSDGKIVRPLLAYSKTELLSYARSHALRWVTDESNADIQYDRNYLRHNILAQLNQRWPEVERRLANTATRLAEADSLLEDYGKQDLTCCDVRAERLGESLCLTALKAYAEPRRRHIVRTWVASHDSYLPDAAQMVEMEKLFDARDDASPVLVWGRLELRRFRARVFLVPKLSLPNQHFVWPSGTKASLNDGSVLEVRGQPSQCIRVRFREGGERCRPEGRGHSQKLKKLFNEYNIEPWLRDRVPLVYVNNVLVAVADVFRTDAAASLLGDDVAFSWYYPALKNS